MQLAHSASEMVMTAHRHFLSPCIDFLELLNCFNCLPRWTTTVATMKVDSIQNVQVRTPTVHWMLHVLIHSCDTPKTDSKRGRMKVFYNYKTPPNPNAQRSNVHYLSEEDQHCTQRRICRYLTASLPRSPTFEINQFTGCPLRQEWSAQLPGWGSPHLGPHQW